jgi:2-C-methyl-D-erythritol 4-phosphate cytidylyltransferase
MTQHDRDPWDDGPGGLGISALGVVLDQDRGSLPFALVHGEPLVACAAWALGEAGVTLVDAGTPWSGVVAAEAAVVLHDPLCPLTPPEFIAECVRAAGDAAEDTVVVGVRPVTDTVKALDGGYVGSTVDRDRLLQVVSPVVVPPTVVAALGGLPTTDLAALVARLAESHPVSTLEAPPTARRVSGDDDLRVLEALTAGEPGPRRPGT